MRLLARTSYPFAHVSCPPTSIALLLPPNLPSQSSTNSSSNKSTTLSTNLRPQDLSTSLKKVAFRRNIVCIPIYPYSLISVLFSSLFCILTLPLFVDTIPSNLSQVFDHFILFSLLLIFSFSCFKFTGFRLRIQSARAQPLQRRNLPPPRSRAHPFTRVDPSATLVVCFQQHRPHAGTINLVTSSINMLFDSTAGRTRMRLHSRWKA